MQDLQTTNAGGLQTSKLESLTVTRLVTGISEFNQVTGGGLVPGSVVLIGGEPGIGKSTILLQLCANVPCKPLYISGEEAASQIALRAQRLGIDTAKFDAAFSTDADKIVNLLDELKPKLVIIDSIQTMHSKEATDSSPGSPNQIKACSGLLGDWAKRNDSCIILVGHITKDGGLAGPKLLEHMVDVVLYFEGERSGAARILRAVKNRYGPTDEVGVFQMQEQGLAEISNPSEFFLNSSSPASPGVIIFPSLEGTRTVLVELQALTLDSHIQIPRRSVVGWDQTRLSMIAAVIENKLKIRLSQKEIYINVVGGMRVQEPAMDLAVTIVLLSAHLQIIIPKNVIAFGEIGLAGEVRPVVKQQARIKEAMRLGMETVVGPYGLAGIVACKTVHDAANWLKELK